MSLISKDGGAIKDYRNLRKMIVELFTVHGNIYLMQHGAGLIRMGMETLLTELMAGGLMWRRR